MSRARSSNRSWRDRRILSASLRLCASAIRFETRRLQRLDTEAQRRREHKGRSGRRAEKKMRWIFRGFLLLVKGTLAMIALAALVLWPYSYGDGESIERSRFTLKPQRVEAVSFTAGWGEGWIGIHSC